MADTERNGLVRFLYDLGGFVSLLAKLLRDDEFSRDTFGFSVDIGVVSRLDTVVDLLDEAADGQADLAEYAAAAAQLAEITETVHLLVEAAGSDPTPGVVAEEIIGTTLDVASLAYVASRWPQLLYVARLFNLLTENLPQEETGEALEAVGAGFWRILRWDDVDGLLGDGWTAMGGDLETEADAKRLSVLLGAIGLAAAYTGPIVDKWIHRHLDPRTFQVLFGWDPDPASTTPVADDISRRFVTIMGRLYDRKEDDDGLITEGSYELTVTMAWVPADHGGPGLWLSLGGGAERDMALGGGWHFVADGDLSEGLELMIPGKSAPDGAGFLRFGTTVGGSLELRLERRDEGTGGGAAGPWRLGSVFEVRAVELSVRLSDRDPMLGGVVRARDAAFTLQRPASGFLRHLVPEGGLRVEFDLGIVADTTPRLTLEGGSGLEVLIPIHTTTSHVQGLHLYLALRKGEKEGDPFAFEASAGFSLKLGPFTAVVDRFGVVLPSAPHGPSGAPWIRFPDAIGIGLDGDVVSGGGFLRFDPAGGRYSGSLSLTVGRWTLTAFGLLTDLPAPAGYSLLLVVSVSWDPPVPGPFGIGLAGIGGVIGHNHGADVAALQAAVRTGAVRTMLFPADPVAAAPQVLTTLANVFPVRHGSSLLGIGLQLSWSRGLMSLVAAVVVESGSTPRVLVLGSLLATVPTPEHPVIRIQVDAVGIIDSARPSVEVDGSLVASFIGPYALTGDATLRFRGAREPAGGAEPTEEDEAIFLVAVGGFHPAFTPPATAHLPPRRRLALSLPMENPRVRLELYAALTSNSLQLGAKLEVSARKGGFTVEAVLGFDALATRDPFHLTVDIQARAAIRHDGTTLAEVSLDLHLDGPSPWHLFGKAKLSLLFFSVSIPIDTTFGSDSPQVPPPAVDAAAVLAAALHDAAAWETTAPAGAAALVAIRGKPAGDVLAAHPAGLLGARQDVLPLGVDLTHVGRARIAPDRFEVRSVTVNGTGVPDVDKVRAQFAAGEFVDLSEDERLSRPAFERFVAGFTAGSDAVVAGPAVSGDLGYEEIVLGPDGAVEEPPRPKRPPLLVALRHGVGVGPAALSPLRLDEVTRGMRREPDVRLAPATRVAVAAGTLAPVSDLPPGVTDTEVRQAIAATADARTGQVLLVLAHEAAP
jgi:hypothetical protein